MKVFYKIIIFFIIYALLAIPDNKSSINVPEKNSLTTNGKWWGKFAQNLVKFRITNNQTQHYYYDKHRGLLKYHLDELLLQLAEPEDPILDSISFHIHKLSALASLVPNKINEFETDVAEWRKLLKYQSRYWDTSNEDTNKRLSQLIIECRLAFESTLVQSGTKTTSFSTLVPSSSVKSKNIGNIYLNSGDVVAFNLSTRNDPYSSFTRELPNLFKHLGSILITDSLASVAYVDHDVGIQIIPLDNFIEKLAPNGIVLRLRDDIPAMIKKPELPTLAAASIYKIAQKGGYKYDYNFDTDTQEYLYDWELINAAYKEYDLDLTVNKIIRRSNSINLGSINSHLKPFEIEFDHRFEIAGEWYNAELLYTNRLLTAATSSIMLSHKKSDFINPILLPLYRVAKAYSMIIGQFDIREPIPSGVSAQSQLVYDALAKEQSKLLSDLRSELAEYEAIRNHKATYLKILQKADELKGVSNN
jgi:hypothetical protein